MYHTSFFCNDPATTEIYTLSLHDALPICVDEIIVFHALTEEDLKKIVDIQLEHLRRRLRDRMITIELSEEAKSHIARVDRKSTRLNSSHGYISYAVFCLKKKKNNKDI